LLPLRAFLGATFAFAGIQKLANPNFFNKTSTISIQSQLASAVHDSPLGGLLVHLQGGAVAIGILIALGEIAVGVGTMLGLFTRVAAAGGLVLSLTLFLTVSFHTSPYFQGADIVFVFGWLPFVVAGGGSRLSLDGLLRRNAAQRRRHHDPEVVAVHFHQIQRHCGHYDHGHCTARHGEECEPVGCPILTEEPTSAPTLTPRTLDRRLMLREASAAGIVAAGTALVGGVVIGTARSLAHSRTTHPSKRLFKVGPSSAVGVQNYEIFTYGPTGLPGIMIQPTSGQYVAYNAVCPHAGCTVGYFSSADIIACPCHGSEFNVQTGDVVQGPAPHGLQKFTVSESGGDLFVI
jgi:thiosulfate dehydrogenase [quinone] large subunit